MLVWRDILLVVGVIIAVLTWFGVPPKKIAQLTKERITSERFIESVSLVAVIIVTGGAIYISFFYRRPIDWGIAAILLYFCFAMWQPIIDYFFSFRDVLRKVISLVVRFGGFPALAVLFTTWDAPVWRKVAPLFVGFVLGIGTRRINDYIRRKRRKRAIKAESSNKK